MPPKVLTRNGDRAGGVLPVTAAARAAPVAKPPALLLKLEIRRLPPGLTALEFEAVLGEEWKLGSGKVDWLEYRPGKVKNGLGKYPVQSRCYLHLVDHTIVKQLEARFLAVEFADKAGTWKNPDLKHLPPTIGFALNQKTPLTTKPRADARQGTIDQDPEFIAFLEAETQPVTKSSAIDSASNEKEKVEKVEVKSTPLIEALREKKAAKEKAKLAKEEKKEGKGHNKGDSKDVKSTEKGSKGGKEQKDGKAQAQTSADSGAKEGSKTNSKQQSAKQTQSKGAVAATSTTSAGATATVASAQSPANGKTVLPARGKKSQSGQKSVAVATSGSGVAPTTQTQTGTNKAAASTPAASAATPPRAPRQRGNTDGIKKMLQKDLGIKPRANATPVANVSTTQPVADTTVNSPAKSTPATNTSNTTPIPPTKPARQTPTAPRAAQTNNQTSQNIQAPATPPTKAYLKHANPTQGMTEILIQQALSQFGEAINVTIDPRKGTAIAIFKDNDALAKALEAKKVPVANGTVEVLAFRTAGGGGGGSGVGGGAKGGRAAGGRGGRGVGGRPAPANTPAGQGGAPIASVGTGGSKIIPSAVAPPAKAADAPAAT